MERQVDWKQDWKAAYVKHFYDAAKREKQQEGVKEKFNTVFYHSSSTIVYQRQLTVWGD